MKLFSYDRVALTGGYLHDRQQQNRKITIPAIYDRFVESGRIGAFDFNWKPDMPHKPHVFYDSDVAKWMESAAYVLKNHPDPELEEKVERLIDRI